MPKYSVCTLELQRREYIVDFNGSASMLVTACNEGELDLGYPLSVHTEDFKVEEVERLPEDREGGPA